VTKVAIDFGTTNTVISILAPNTQTPQTVKLPQLTREVNGVNLVPSLVFIENPETIIVGEKAREKFLQTPQTERLFQGFKKDLAAEYRSPARQIDGLTYTSELVCELFLLKLWNELLTQNIQPSQVIFTLPLAGFDLYYNWFKQFATKINVPTVQIIDEPTAAANGYTINQPESIILAIDFGGGTLDLSLVTTPKNPGAKVVKGKAIATASAYLGGIDIDNWISENYLQQIGLSKIYLNSISWQNLLQVAESLKIKLSQTIEATGSWKNAEGISQEICLNRKELERILTSEQLLDQIKQTLDEILQTALTKGIGKNEIKQVILVGGSCLIPAVQKLIIDYFGQEKVKLNKPLTAVSFGALSIGESEEILTNLEHSYALRLWEKETQTYTNFRLFNPGTRYPCRRQKPIILQAATDGQLFLRLELGKLINKGEVTYDAESGKMGTTVEQQSEYQPLDHPHQPQYIVPLQPPGEIDKDRLMVAFAVNEQGIVIATVTDLLRRRILVNKGVPLETVPSHPPSTTIPSPDAAVFGREQNVESQVVELPVVQKNLVKHLRQVEILHTLKGHSGSVKAIAISPDSKLLASGSQDTSIRLWSLHKCTWWRTLEIHNKPVTSLAFSPDKPLLASGSEDNQVILWITKTCEAARTFTDHNNPVFSLAFSENGQILASGGWDNYINLRQVFGRSLPTRLPANSGGIALLAFSSDGQTLVSCGDKTVNVWNINTRSLIYSLTAHSDLVISIAISPDGQTLATCGGMQDKTIKLWHLSSGELLHNCTGVVNSASNLVFHPSGDILASANYNKIHFWDVGTGKLQHSLTGNGANILCLAFSPDGEQLVTGDADGIITVWG